jgi:hypothetical protein
MRSLRQAIKKSTLLVRERAAWQASMDSPREYPSFKNGPLYQRRTDMGMPTKHMLRMYEIGGRRRRFGLPDVESRANIQARFSSGIIV